MIVFYKDKSMKWRCRIKAANGNILFVSSEGYSNKQDCVQALMSTHNIIINAIRNNDIEKAMGGTNGGESD